MPSTLAEWLEFVERQHPQSMALGLERVTQVLQRLDASVRCPVITVGGTNGKGSTCALLESILHAAGYRTGLYTSPHLLRYNERVRIGAEDASDAALCEAYAAVERARQGVPLTYFEFGTLAAWWLFAREAPEAAILEVGLGGRLDAVNAFEPDAAVLTSIAIDHVDYLGATREDIGREKAGILRSGKPAVIADADPPRSVLEEAQRLAAGLLRIGLDFGYDAQPGQWSYWGPGGRRAGLAYPALRGAIQLRNAAAAIAVLDAMRARLAVSARDIRLGLAQVALPGRFQVLPGRPQVILDVAHNPEAASVLADNLSASGFAPATHAVFGMLRDKDVAGVVRALGPRITRWHVASLGGPRGARSSDLARIIAAQDARASVCEHATPAAAYAAAGEAAHENDKIVVFGSFLMVAEVMAHLKGKHG